MHKFKQGNKLDGANNNCSCSVDSPRQSTISSVKEEPKGSLSTLPIQQTSEEKSISETNKMVYISNCQYSYAFLPGLKNILSI
jgi:hypothetical protein